VVPTEPADSLRVAATFVVSFQEDAVVYYKYIREDRDSKGRLRLTAYEDGEPLKPMVAGDDYVITPDGRRISHVQVRQEVRRNQRVSEYGFQSRSRCSRCLNRQFYICSVATTIGCALLPGVGPFICGWYINYVNQTGSGCRAAARVRCYFRIKPPPCP
jgi:hypothetical protein